MIRRSLFDDARFQRLSANARLVLIALKTDLHSTGIGIGYPGELEGKLAPRTGLTAVRVRRAIAELKESGWVEHDGVLIWIVDALHDDPGMSSANPRHVVAVRRHLSSLPFRNIIKHFAVTYPDWFEGDDDHDDDKPDGEEGSGTLSDSLPHSLSHSVTDQGRRETVDGIQETGDGGQEEEEASQGMNGAAPKNSVVPNAASVTP